METVKIKRFLSGYGSGSGYSGSGSGSGDGDGSGDGSGSGYSGSGSGSGYGDGSGDGYGYGSGYGDGSGDGYGYGSGYGDGSGYSGYGSGSGSGDGSGDGSGSGSGYGDGSGDGSGSGSGIQIEMHQGSSVHYIDKLPCVIRSIKRDIALVDVIDVNSFELSRMFVAKHGGLFAHGKTIEEAMEAAQSKWAETRSIEDRIDEFKSHFKKGVKYDANLFYKWHTILTGSCQSGKDFWIKQQGVDLSKPITVKEFFDLTKNAYGSETIRRLMDHYK